MSAAVAEPGVALAPRLLSAAAPVRLRWLLAGSMVLAVSVAALSAGISLATQSQSLVRAAALDGAARQAEVIDEQNRQYARVALHLKSAGVRTEHDWERRRGAMPPAATMTNELGKQLADREAGWSVRLYSDFPFKHTPDGGPRDDFERRALEELRRDPTRPYFAFEEVDGRSVVRYATAQVMDAACVACHNAHAASSKADWKVGDVRGVLEVVQPVEATEARIHASWRTAGMLGAGSGVMVLGLCGAVLLLRRPGTVHPPQPPPPPPREPEPSSPTDPPPSSLVLLGLPHANGRTAKYIPLTGSRLNLHMNGSSASLSGPRSSVGLSKVGLRRIVLPDGDSHGYAPQPGDVITPSARVILVADFDTERQGMTESLVEPDSRRGVTPR